MAIRHATRHALLVNSAGTTSGLGDNEYLGQCVTGTGKIKLLFIQHRKFILF